MVMRLLHRYNGTQHVPQLEDSRISGEVYESDEWKAWLKDKIEGLGISENALPEFMLEVSALADLLNMKDSDVEDIRNTMSTSERNHRGSAGQTFKLNSRSCRRLKGIVNVIGFLSIVRRNPTLSDLKWSKVQPFLLEWEALKKLSEVEPPTVPRYQSNKGMPAHMQSMYDFFGRCYGGYYCPLTYLLCEDMLRDESSPIHAAPFVIGKYYCANYVRIVDEIHARAPRDTATAQADNELIYKHLADSLTGTQAESVLQEFERTRDGRGLWLRIQETQCSSAVLKDIAMKHLNYLQTAIWDYKMALDQYIDKQRHINRRYEEAASKCGMQTYTDHSKVTWLLRGLAKVADTDTALAIRIDRVKDDTSHMNDFEKAATYLAATDYKGKGLSKKKRVTIAGEVSVVEGDGASTPNAKKLKSGAGDGALRGPKTGVLLKWYDDKAEFRKLTGAQKQELAEWRKANNVDISGSLASAKKNRASQKKQSSAYRKGFAKLASLLKSKVPDATAEVDSIVAGVEASIGSVVVNPIAPSGETTPGSASTAGTAEIAGNSASVASVSNQAESGVAPEVLETIEKQVEAAAVTGVQSILKVPKRKD